MSEKVRFGIVGAGWIAQSYTQAILTLPNLELTAVADIRKEAADSLSETGGCKSYTSYQEMAEKEKLDAVVICTPPDSHPEISLHFLKQKVNVLCEKPFCIEVEDAENMATVAQEMGVLLTMASKFRCVNDVIKAKSIIESGVLGEIVLYENAFTARVDMSERWNSDPKVSGGGVLIDNGTHSLDLMRYLLGPLAKVQVVEGIRSDNMRVEETVQIFARSQKNVMGNIDLSWKINKELSTFITLYGTQGTLSIGWKGSRYKTNSSPDWTEYGEGYDKIKAFAKQLSNFAGAIRGEEELLITAEDAIASVKVVKAAYRSLQKNNWEQI